MVWTEKQIQKFIEDEYIGHDVVYADKIMRPMAAELCKDVLHAFDQEWNVGENPLGPNWHAFAGELERSIKTAHRQNDDAKLHDYYSFLNWALFEKTSYLHKEAIISPFEGIIDIAPKKWMKYIPTIILERMTSHMSVFMFPHISSNMRTELKRLNENMTMHTKCWRSCHEKFTKVAERHSIPFTNLL